MVAHLTSNPPGGHAHRPAFSRQPQLDISRTESRNRHLELATDSVGQQKVAVIQVSGMGIIVPPDLRTASENGSKVTLMSKRKSV
jgi:hypothetical protein